MTASQVLGAAAPAATFEHFVVGDTAATFLGLTRRTLLQKVRDGKIPGHALDPSAGKKAWRFLVSELHAYMVRVRNAAIWNTQTTKEGLMPRYQLSSFRKKNPADGLTWVLRYYATRSDGQRVERTIPIGLVKDIGLSPADASREADRQKLRETINQFAPTPTKPELRRTRQGAGPLTRLPSVSLDRTFAVPVQPTIMEAKEENRTVQDRPSHVAQYTDWLSTAEAAAYLNFKVRTIQLWARQGRLKAYALAGAQRHVWRFLRSDLDAIAMHRKTYVKLGPAVRAL